MGIENPEYMMFIAKMLGTAIAVFLGICFFIGLLAGDSLGIEPLKIPDKVDIGYINDYSYATSRAVKVVDNEKAEIQQLRNKLERMRIEKQLKDLQKKSSEDKRKKKCEQSPLMKECVEVLVSMGEKKQIAIDTVHKYFKTHPETKTTNDFILGVFKREAVKCN